MDGITYFVYLIVNIINHKIYVGKTKDTNQRLKEHRRKSKNKKPKYPLHRAMKKYGINNFKLHIIEEFNSESGALEAEKFWIEFFRTNISKFGDECGYNLTDGGEGVSGFRHSEQTKAHWSKTRKGKMAGANHPFFGKPRSEQMKNKSSIKQLGKKIPKNIVDKIADKNRGKKRSEEFKTNLSEMRRGERNPGAKLDWEKIDRIRKLLKDGILTQTEIADIFKVAPNTISRIKNNIIWKV